MNILLDKLSATIIASVITLMIVTINHSNAESIAETTAFYSISTQTESFAKIIRRDLQGVADVITINEDVLSGGATEFRFTTRIGLDTTLHTIAYRKTYSFTRQQDTTTFFQIERYVDGVLDGGSKDVITAWEIRALNEDAGTITNPDDAAQVVVRFVTASPMVAMDVIQNIEWESRFFPPLRN